MSIQVTDYIVMSTRKPPNHDSGSWSTHHDEADARDCARQVGGTPFKRVTTYETGERVAVLTEVRVGDD